MTARRVRGLAVGAALLLALAGCGGTPTPSRPSDGARHGMPSDGMSSHGMSGHGMRGIAHGRVLDHPLPAATRTARLVDQHGRVLDLDALRGRIVVLAPLLTGCPATGRAVSAQLHRAALVARQALVGDRVVTLQVAPGPVPPRQVQSWARSWPPLANWLVATGRPGELDTFWHGVAGHRPRCGGPVTAWVLDPDGRVRWSVSGRPGAAGGWGADLLDEGVAYVYDAPPA